MPTQITRYPTLQNLMFYSSSNSLPVNTPTTLTNEGIGMWSFVDIKARKRKVSDANLQKHWSQNKLNAYEVSAYEIYSKASREEQIYHKKKYDDKGRYIENVQASINEYNAKINSVQNLVVGNSSSAGFQLPQTGGIMARVLTPKRQHVSTVTVGKAYEFIQKTDGSELWNYCNDNGKVMRLDSTEMNTDWTEFTGNAVDPINPQETYKMKLETFTFLDGVKVKDLSDEALIERLRNATTNRDDLKELGLDDKVLKNRTAKTNEYIAYITDELKGRDKDSG